MFIIQIPFYHKHFRRKAHGPDAVPILYTKIQNTIINPNDILNRIQAKEININLLIFYFLEIFKTNLNWNTFTVT
jgi:hypothetical protein